MSDAAPSGGGFGFFIAFFALIIFLAIYTTNNDGIFSDMSTSTPSYATGRSAEEQTLSSGSSSGGSGSSYSAPQPAPAPKLTPQQIEDRVAQIYRDLDNLREDVRKALLREPVSPYRDKVTLSSGSVYDTNPDREYLMLRADYNNPDAIAISHWYLESYVTKQRSALPNGRRLMTSSRSPASEEIFLKPGESAYIITGESPIHNSFHENICTGYLNREYTFSPSLGERCLYPREEMKRFGDIKLDNDTCYDFVERMNSCRTPSDEDLSEAKLTRGCKKFIEDTFNYNDCVSLHRYDPYFERDGYWHIYLGEPFELWRPKREIIRLMDEQDRVIDVIEY